MAEVSIQCHAIEVKRGRLDPKRVTSALVTITGKEIYVGASAQWKIKVKEIQIIDVMSENDNVIFIEHIDKTTFRFIPKHPQSHEEIKRWETFIARLVYLHDKVNTKEVNGYKKNLGKSSKCELGGDNNSTTQRATKTLSSQRSVFSSLDNQPRTTVSQQQRQRRGKYGQQKAMPPLVPLHDRNDWETDRFSASNNTFVPAIKVSDKKKKRKLIHPMEEQFSSDEEDHEPLDNDEENAENENGETASSSQADEPLTQEQSGVEEKPELGNENDNTNLSNSKKGQKALRKRKNPKIKNRISKMNDKTEESSDDDDIFGSVDVTTPFVQRLVSPSTTSTLLQRSTTSRKAAKASILDEMDDSTEEETLIDKRQPSIHSFFQPRTKSEVPANAALTPSIRTPARRTHHTERNTKPSLVTTIHHSKGSTTKMEEDSIKWLMTSPTRNLRSPQESRRIELFGHDLSMSSPNRSKIDTHNVLDNDPIEQFTSPPRSRSNVESHRSAFGERSNSAYRPLDYSNTRPRAPILLNRFANSNSTPSALMQHASHITTITRESNIATSNTMSFHRKFRGLRNLGNTCYQNSSLQMLYSCRHLMAALRDCMSRWERSRSDGTITKSICMIGEELSRYYMAPVNSRMIKDAMDVVTDKYLGYEQRDAHEFISDLIDFVHDELQANGSKDVAQNDNSENTDSTKEPFPTDDFCMSVQVCLKCCSCGYTRNKEEMYRHLSIDIISDDEVSQLDSKNDEVVQVSLATVEKSLEHFFQPETREIKCEKCEEGSHAEQTLRIISQPKLLLLHLKRFIVVERMIYPAVTAIDTENQPPNVLSSATSSSTAPIAQASTQIEYVFKKNKAPVEIPTSLSLEAYHQHLNKLENAQTLTGPTKASSMESPKHYSLQSIVHHIGSTASSGHYTADAIREVSCETQDENIIEAAQKDYEKSNSEKVWVSFDDGITSETTAEKILSNRLKQSTAYMLLYASKDI